MLNVTRESACSFLLKARSATVSASLSAGSATRPDHKHVVDHDQPAGTEQLEAHS